MIDIGNLRLTLGGKLLYDDLSWRILDGSKVGLVGANGSGKTTLLKVLMGLIEPDGGTVTMPSKAKVGYLPQDLHELPNVSVMSYIKESAGIDELESSLRKTEDELGHTVPDSPEQRRALERYERAMEAFERAGGYSFDAMAKKAIKGLGFSPADGNRPTSEFSGGWKMRISLAAALMSRPDVLLLDEPTNHLDTESMEWLEGWLMSYPGTVVAISHDRRFMDRIMGSIAELSNRRICEYKGNFSQYLEESARRLEQLEKERLKQQEEIEKTRQFIDRFRYKATKAAQVQSRIRKLERMEEVRIDGQVKTVSIRFPKCPRSGHSVLEAAELSKSYADLSVFEDLEFQLTRGEKVALVGVNGAGKSTLSRLIAGRELPDEGFIELGHNVSMGFFSQESSQNLDYDNTIWEEIDRSSDRLSPEGKRTLLGAFLFSGEDIHKRISVLSGGEKSRVALVKLLLQETNFLVLDEPTNHLDMSTKELFQRALLEYDGTMIIVSHDRYFLDNLVERVLEIRGGRLYDYPGNYSYFIEKRDQTILEETESTSGKNDEPPSLKDRKRAEAELRNRIYREKRRFVEELAPLEKTISDLETKKETIHEDLCDPKTLEDSSRVRNLMVDLKNVEDELDRAMARWEELMEAIESVEAQP
ncbi:MAG: ABC-F family ATP-binding cassette domain-containing protein [Synergistota bacterium]|nr:ABC-F family ATP-binding cassette domain-containing protein [Synergistota bacterium]